MVPFLLSQLAELLDTATEELTAGQQIEWRASSYMEIDAAMGGSSQKNITPDLELLRICQPILQHCDRIFTRWYSSLHGKVTADR